MIETYSLRAGAGAVLRIGTPHEHDVLSGRGGAINSHIGNQRFRDWVRERKNDYNLARTKAEKARVANEVMDLVKNRNPPGRFLQRDQSSVTGGMTWWVEVDEVKAMAKTSQALREGAPSIRAAHKDELQTTKKRGRRTKKSTAVAPKPVSVKRSHQVMQQQTITVVPTLAQRPSLTMRLYQGAPIPVPVSSHPATPVSAPVAAPVPAASFDMSHSQAIEQLKANVEAAKSTDNKNSPTFNPPPSIPTLLTAPIVAPPQPLSNDVSDETISTINSASFYRPPLKRSRLSENLYLPTVLLPASPHRHPQPHIVKPEEDTPPLAPLPSPIALDDIPELGEFPMPAMPKRETSLRRANSLALSDVGTGSDSWGELEFVNPFEGDTSEELSAILSPFESNTTPRSSRNSISNTSVKSELSDLCDANALCGGGATESEFGEAMKDVYDVVHPGLGSPGTEEPIPTHLYPSSIYRGSYDLTRRTDSLSSPQLIL